MHVRQQIRAAVVSALKGLPATGPRVYPGRTHNLGAAHDPSLLVYTRDEDADRDSMGDRNRRALARGCQLYVECRVSAAAPPDDLLDDIAEDVEKRMQSAVPAGLVKDIILQRTQIDVRAGGEHHVGECRLQYRIEYRTLEADPGVAE